MKHSYIRIFIASVLLTGLTSCNKYLDKKPVISQVTISNISDAQAVLDKYDFINQNGASLLEGLADNYYHTTATFNALDVNMQSIYLWDKNANDYGSWSNTYSKPVYYANVVLDALQALSVPAADKSSFDRVCGSALFIRAFAFYGLAQLYCRPYSATAQTDPGIVLRLSSDINIPSTRSTVQQTYDQVIADLKKAADLLPENSGYATRPNKISAYGALARVYLSMGAYVNAGKYADLYLTKQSTLMDYNTINVSASPVFPLFNPEYIYYSRPYLFTAATSLLGAKIDSVLYKSYAANDLRKSLFFSTNADGSIAFRGSYEGQAGVFASVPVDGICTDEMYLVRSECYARAGNKNAALDDLNALLIKRWKTNLFMGVTATDAADALTKILAERRKELLFRSVRWTDIRRLNLEGANITLQRLINGVVYTLPPNDLRYVELIPVEVLNLAPLPQNPR
jgi:hypothetical protein